MSCVQTLGLVCHGAVCGGCCGASGAVHRQIPAEIQGILRMIWRCDKPECARVVLGTAFSRSWSFTLRGDSHRCCSLGLLQRIYPLLQFQQQTCPCAILSLLPSTAHTSSSGVHPAVTLQSTDVPSVAWEPFPAGERPQPDPPSAPGKECNGAIRMQVGRILHSHISHLSVCVCHPGFHTYNFSLSLPIQTLSFAF